MKLKNKKQKIIHFVHKELELLISLKYCFENVLLSLITNIM